MGLASLNELNEHNLNFTTQKIMKKLHVLLLGLFLTGVLSPNSIAQTITWTDTTSSYTLPEGVKLYFGKRASPALTAWYLEVDTKVQKLALVPYLSKKGVQSISSFSAEVGAYAAINGGYFGGTSSYSTVIHPGKVLAQNVTALTRNAKSYPVIRSMFSIKEDRSMSVDWIYHFGTTINDVYKFNAPMAYTPNSEPLPAPVPDSGEVYTDVFLGLGGGPVLVKGGVIVNTYNEEIFWGSGVENNEPQPRTAVGYTEDGRAILLVADGRAINTQGLTLPELAQVMIDLGCVEAINLDGGGSSQMVVGGVGINANVDLRNLATILAIVPRDSIPRYEPQAAFEQIVDTGEADKVRIVGNWFETANTGYYGGTKSLITLAGDGSATVTFKPTLPVEDTYEVYAWWVASSNRSTATPFVVYYKDNVDTVYKNQVLNHAQWVKIGDYPFTGSSADSVIVSNRVNQTGTYVVADAIRFVKVQTTSIEEEITTLSELPNGIRLLGNYPNPFNPSTTIQYSLAQSGNVEIVIYNALGERVSGVLMGNQMAGTHQFVLDAKNLSSGVYVYQVVQRGSKGIFTASGKMILIK